MKVLLLLSCVLACASANTLGDDYTASNDSDSCMSRWLEEIPFETPVADSARTERIMAALAQPPDELNIRSASLQTVAVVIGNEKMARLFVACLAGDDVTCQQSRPCHNGGHCVINQEPEQGYVCQCESGFTGRYCENMLQPPHHEQVLELAAAIDSASASVGDLRNESRAADVAMLGNLMEFFEKGQELFSAMRVRFASVLVAANPGKFRSRTIPNRQSQDTSAGIMSTPTTPSEVGDQQGTSSSTVGQDTSDGVMSTPTTPSEVGDQQGPCASLEFYCYDADIPSCIPLSWQCDGEPDCTSVGGSSDERNCP